MITYNKFDVSIWVRFSFLILNFGSDQCEYRWLFVILNPRGGLVLIQTLWSMEEEQIVTLLHWEGLDLHPLEVHFICFRHLNIYRGWIRCGPQCECWQCIKRNPSSIMANFNFRLEMNKFNHVSFLVHKIDNNMDVGFDGSYRKKSRHQSISGKCTTSCTIVRRSATNTTTTTAAASSNYLSILQVSTITYCFCFGIEEKWSLQVAMN